MIPSFSSDAPAHHAVAQPCKSGCGFFGNAQSDGHCSACFKLLPKSHTQSVAPILTPTIDTNPTSTNISNPAILASSQPSVPLTTSDMIIESSQSEPIAKVALLSSQPDSVASSSSSFLAQPSAPVSSISMPTTPALGTLLPHILISRESLS